MECMAGAEKGDNSDVKSSSGSSSSCSDSKDKVNSDNASTSEEVSEEISEGACGGTPDLQTSPSGSCPQSPKPSCTAQEQETVDFKVIFNKVKHNVTFPYDNTVLQLKNHLNAITGVPQSMQKIMIKGLAKDEQSLREAGVIPGAKVMLVGSKLDDVMSVAAPQKVEIEDKVTISKEPLCRQKMHRDILDKGIPEDVMPGILNSKEALPPYPLSGMLNKWGGKVRLTFKLEQDEVWIGTKEKTQKLSMNSIRNVVSEPIEGYEQYHLLAMQLGPSESSRYWVYWVPVQYVDAIKDTIMGSWAL